MTTGVLCRLAIVTANTARVDERSVNTSQIAGDVTDEADLCGKLLRDDRGNAAKDSGGKYIPFAGKESASIAGRFFLVEKSPC